MIKPIFSTKEEKVVEDYGLFIFEPLPPSFGHSLGNILRRSLLSSLEGLAITDVKISQVSHLFSTIAGVKESVLEIILNLKQLRFKATTQEGPFKIYFEKKGKGEVYGGDFKGEVEVVNKDLYLFEITDDKTQLEIEAIVSKGYGYLAVEDREEKKSGYIPIDAYFSPVKKVNFRVEPSRVGRKDNFERLILEIWTDKSANPKEALINISNLLTEYFKHFFFQEQKPDSEKKVKKNPNQVATKEFEELIIDELNFPSRVVNALLKEGIETVADLIKLDRKQIEKMKGVGAKSIKLIDEELKKLGIELK